MERGRLSFAMRHRMRISRLMSDGYSLLRLVGAISAGVILSLPWLVRYLTTRFVTGHGDGGTSSITPGLRPNGTRSLRMFGWEVFVKRRRDSDGVDLVRSIYSVSDGQEPLHIIIVDHIPLASGRKQGHGAPGRTLPRFS